MPVTKMARIKDAINLTFETIGSVNGTKMPKIVDGDNKAPIAWEYWLANHLAGLAQGRADKAREAAVKSGVIFDHKLHPKPASYAGKVFDNDQVFVMVNVNSGSTRIDTKQLVASLIEAGVSQSVVDRAIGLSTKKVAPAHTFKVYLHDD
jgi:hypothetical protein